MVFLYTSRNGLYPEVIHSVLALIFLKIINIHFDFKYITIKIIKLLSDLAPRVYQSVQTMDINVYLQNHKIYAIHNSTRYYYWSMQTAY